MIFPRSNPNPQLYFAYFTKKVNKNFHEGKIGKNTYRKTERGIARRDSQTKTPVNFH